MELIPETNTASRIIATVAARFDKEVFIRL